MKYKLILITITASLLTFIIYHYCYHFHVNITSINSYDSVNNYNEELSSKLTLNNNKYKLNVDFSSPNLETENLISLIKDNTYKIQEVLHDSEVIIISIGNIDMKTENIKTILQEYNRLFKLLRKYNNKEIIFLSPISFKNITELKDLTHTYNIILINTSSSINNYNSLDSLTKEDANKLSNLIIKKISI